MKLESAHHTRYRRNARWESKTHRGDWSVRTGILLTLYDDEGQRGVGECAPLPGFSDASLTDCERALEALCERLRGVVVESSDGGAALLADCVTQLPPEVSHALDQALLELSARVENRALDWFLGARGELGKAALHRLVSDVEKPLPTVNAWLDSDVFELCAFKLKVGAMPWRQDFTRVQALADKLPTGVLLRLDANRAWDFETAVRFLEAARGLPLQLLEEPLVDSDEVALSELRHRFGVAIGVDESCRTLAALERVIERGAADVVVLKPMFNGGPRASLKLAERAAQAGLRVLVTGAFETEVGRRTALALASSCRGRALMGCGFDSPFADTGPEQATLPCTQREAPSARLASLRVPCPLHNAAVARPLALAVDDGQRALCWSELEVEARKVAWLLSERFDIGPGERVVMSARASTEWVVALHALNVLGAVAAPLAAGPQWEQQLRELRPRLVIVDDDGSAPTSSPSVGLQTLTLNRRADDRFSNRKSSEMNRKSVVVSEARNPNARAVPPFPAVQWNLNAVRVVLWTSGSSGTPKLVELTGQQLLFSALGSAQRLGHLPGDRWLCCLPLQHVGGLSILFRALFFGTAVRLCLPFDTEAVVAELFTGEVNLVSLVPTMLQRLLDARPEAPPSALRAVLLGGAAASPELLERCAELRWPVALTWGMSETASQVATSAPGELGAGLAPLAFVDVEADESGVLAVSGPIVQGQRLHTSDRGTVDERGRVTLLGRVDDIIISGGENVSAGEIERVLLTHPAVAEARVVSVPSREWGARPVALLTSASEARPESAELDAFMRAHLEPLRCPDAYFWLEALPSSALGKSTRVLPAELLQAVDFQTVVGVVGRPKEKRLP